jgi:hypothetical protein
MIGLFKEHLIQTSRAIIYKKGADQKIDYFTLFLLFFSDSLGLA